ncbi:MAG: hypothetical protein HY805_00810 [Nitrospirae bacterium]|nr:hypothetical protein [Nitrospirota bacterium]
MNSLEIKEVYRDYRPPADAAEVIRRLIYYVPSEYLRNLHRIVLTNSSTLSRSRRRGKTWYRNKKVRIPDSLGLYHKKWNDTPAWIEIFVDNIVNSSDSITFRIPCLREMAFAHVLFHELGHHIHKAIHPEHNEREDVAEKWEKKLTRLFVRKRYWYVVPFRYPLILIVKGLKNCFKSRNRDRCSVSLIH